MTKQEVVAAFRLWAEPHLRDAGFSGHRGHYVRRAGGVTQVVELQHSIYGERFTSNLGLDLEWLLPSVRWISRPSVGPHAHDAVRWIRIGLIGPEKSDHWWGYGTGTEGLELAMRSLAEKVRTDGIEWLDEESAPERFVAHARELVDRSRSDRHPDGGFIELRLMAAVLAWSGDGGGARRYANKARACWTDEKERLEKARRTYRKKHATDGRLPGVPNLLTELDRLISPTKDDYPFVAPKRARRPSRSGLG
jgi:hypothetical protein